MEGGWGETAVQVSITRGTWFERDDVEGGTGYHGPAMKNRGNRWGVSRNNHHYIRLPVPGSVNSHQDHNEPVPLYRQKNMACAR